MSFFGTGTTVGGPPKHLSHFFDPDLRPQLYASTFGLASRDKRICFQKSPSKMWGQGAGGTVKKGIQIYIFQK